MPSARSRRKPRHSVNQKGVPVELRDTEYYGDYWASVALTHFMRDDDQKQPISDLIKKFPCARSSGIVAKERN
jgi:hypothetical protein